MPKPKAAKQGRKLISASIKIEQREQLEAILAHHFHEGRINMSRTQVIEQLIEREAKRLKLT